MEILVAHSLLTGTERRYRPRKVGPAAQAIARRILIERHREEYQELYKAAKEELERLPR